METVTMKTVTIEIVNMNSYYRIVITVLVIREPDTMETVTIEWFFYENVNNGNGKYGNML
jgi:hypothetical protein